MMSLFAAVTLASLIACVVTKERKLRLFFGALALANGLACVLAWRAALPD